jgi:hypothetical protein
VEIVLMSTMTACLATGPAGAVDLDKTTTSRKIHERGAAAREVRARLEQEPDKPPVGGDKAAITLHQVYAMSFGTLCDNDGYVVLDPNDTITEDPDHLVYGGAPFSAEITITGDPFTSIRIGCTSPGAPGMTLSDFTSNHGDLPITGLVLDASGELTLHLGATLTLSVAAEPGEDQAIDYTITAIYE